MLVAVALHTAGAILIQLCVQNVYNLEAVGKSDLSKMTSESMPNLKKRGSSLSAPVSTLLYSEN